MESLRDKVDEITLEDPRETENTNPLKEVTPISIHPNYTDRHIMIGTELPRNYKCLGGIFKEKL